VGPDTLELDAMELDTGALVPYAGPKILLQNLLVLAPIS
jgi:hypothetical protein